MSFNDLPYIRDIVEVGDVCRPKCKCPEAKSGEQNAIEDRRLTNWKRWMEERRIANRTIGDAVKRRPGELLMNYSEDLRPIKEDKMVFEHTRIPHPHDYYRGNPAFWKTPAALSSKCKNTQSYYFKAMTKEEKCEIPEIEYVEVPDATRKEKDTFALGYRNPKDLWEYSTYRRERATSLKTQIKHVEPHKPVLKNLFVKGTSVGTDARKVTLDSTPRKCVTVSVDESNTEDDVEDYMEANGVKLSPNSPGTIYMHFEYDLNSKGIVTKVLTIKNLSLTALRCHFHKIKKNNLFKDIIDDGSDDILFMFQKNILVMIPKSTEEIPIHFKVDVPGTFQESWEFHTCPWDIKLRLNLVAVASVGDLEDKCEKIKRELDEKVKTKVLQQTIDEVLSKIPMPKGNTVIYTYDKALIFEAVNQDYNPIVTRPKYLYNKTVVKQLEIFYNKVRLPCHSETWNYNVEDLKMIAKQRERVNFDQRVVDEMQSAKLLDKQSNDVDESVTKSNEIERSSDQVDEDPKLYLELEDLLMKLERPSVWVNLDQNKYAWSYVILCTHVDAMCRDAEDIKIDLGVSQTSIFPYLKRVAGIKSGRRRFEYLDDLPPPHTKIISYDFDKSDKPASECIKDVPIDDSLRRYRVYYDVPEEEPKLQPKKAKGKKGGKGDKKAAKVDKKSKAKSKKGDEVKPQAAAPQLFKVNESFDPYEEIDAPSILDEEPPIEIETVEVTENNQRLMEQYRMDLYLVFYKHLEDAVCRIADVCEHQKQRRLKLGLFKRILDNSETPSGPVRLKAIDLRAVIENCVSHKKPTHKEQAKKHRDEMIQKWRCEIGEKSTEKETSEQDDHCTDRWISEVVQDKEKDSLWSILQAPKKPAPPDKPISYPVTHTRTKSNTRKKMLEDFGNVMSNAGIDPNWEDFKEVGVQTLNWADATGDEGFSMESIIDEALQKVYELARGEGAIGDGDFVEEEEVFYDEDVSIEI